MSTIAGMVKTERGSRVTSIVNNVSLPPCYLINTENAHLHMFIYVFVRLEYSVNFAYHPTKPDF